MANKPYGGLSSAQQVQYDNDAKKNNALWYTFTGIGRAYLIRRGSDAALSADTSGVHGYSTIEQAYTNPNGVNTLAQATITQWNEQASLPFGGGTLGVVETANVTPPTTPGGPIGLSTPQNPTTAALSKLTGDWEHIMLRVGEVLLGLVLIGVGLARLTGTQNIVSAALKTAIP